MEKTTIDIGIDLGTTNSSIAQLKGTNIEVYKNDEQAECTPSAVWMDKQGRIQVGRRAKAHLEIDPGNSFAEFKLKMGKQYEAVFQRNGKKMLPEELSAEVLKFLKQNVEIRTGFNINAAVITVPANFKLPSCDATKRAAQLAGLTTSPLLQEPVAAAMAYGFQTESENVFWLVYDFGGGTFDAAIIRVKEGMIEVVDHAGDNNLGGKLIDWDIVNHLLTPAISKKYKLSNFKRGNPQWGSVFAKLKREAEEAKIRIALAESTTIVIEPLCNDDQGLPVDLDLEITKKDILKLAKPYITESINICRKLLADNKLGTKDIEKVLLVGGTTLLAGLREILLDREEGLGILLESSIDPLTVVARGAAIFAGTQRIAIDWSKVEKGYFLIEMPEFKPVGSDIEPFVGGRVVGDSVENMAGFTIEFINREARPEWRSGKISVSQDGGFTTCLWAEKGRKNIYEIELLNQFGSRQNTTPKSISYTVGKTVDEVPLINSVGVALANNETCIYFEKGVRIPTKKRHIHRTAFEVSKGQTGDLICIPVVEGENTRRADRNRLIGNLEIHAKDIRRTIPVGSEVEVILEIDESRMVKAKAYIPILDEEFDIVLSQKIETVQNNTDKLLSRFEDEKERLEEIKSQMGGITDENVDTVLSQLEKEGTLEEIESALRNASDDEDIADRAENKLLHLKSETDKLEEQLEWPTLVKKANQELNDAKSIIEEIGNQYDLDTFRSLEREINAAIKSHNQDLLRKKIGSLDGLKIRVLRTQPAYWVSLFELILAPETKAKLLDQIRADRIINDCRTAMENNNLERFKEGVEKLLSLLPYSEQKGLGATIL